MKPSSQDTLKEVGVAVVSPPLPQIAKKLILYCKGGIIHPHSLYIMQSGNAGQNMKGENGD
jgi:hypothetical protein